MQQMPYSLLPKRQTGENTAGNALCRPANAVPLSSHSAMARIAVKFKLFQDNTNINLNNLMIQRYRNKTIPKACKIEMYCIFKFHVNLMLIFLYIKNLNYVCIL